MKTKFRNLIIVIVAFAAIISTVYITRFQDEIKNESNTSAGPTVKSSEGNKNNKPVNNIPIRVNASYRVDFSTIEGMKSEADAIVLATLVNREQYSEVAVKSTLAVSKTIKGKHLDQIYLFEVGTVDWASSDMLSKDTKYMLFLTHRWPDKPEIEDEFFITGGITGIISIDGNTMHSYGQTIDKDLQKILKDYDKSKTVDIFIEKMSEIDTGEEPVNQDGATEVSG